MKKIIIYGLVLALFFSMALSLDCQYTEKEPYSKEVNTFYQNGTELNYDLLEVKDISFYQYKCSLYKCPAYQFKVYNNHNDFMNVTIFYIQAGQLLSTYREIAAEGYALIDHHLGKNPPGTLDPESIKFTINNPSIFESKREVRTFEQDVCQQCPGGSGFACLNDGATSDSDEKCGSGKKNILGLCVGQGADQFIAGDGIASTELGENCANSPLDVQCGNFSICSNSGVCIDDCDHPIDGKSCCLGKFKDIKKQLPNMECGCDFECVDHYQCRTNKICKPNPSSPPPGMYYHQSTDTFRTYAAINLDENCLDDRDCSVGVCYQDKCQKILEPELRCPSGTNIRKGESLLCNIYASNTLLGKDIETTFILEADSGLSFSQSDGCANIVGSQCIGTYDVSSRSNKGINVELTAKSSGDINVTGNVKFNYKNKVITENVAIIIHVSDCGDNITDKGETKKNCCADVGVSDFHWYKIVNEECVSNVFSYKPNWPMIILFGLIIFKGALLLIGELTRLTEAKQKKIAKGIEKIEAEIRKKQKEISMDNELIHKFEQEKEKEEELKIIKERIKESTHEITELRNKEKEEKIKLKEGRARPFTNKQGHQVIINDHGYEQFAKNLKYPNREGLAFHRWYAKKHIYYKNRKKFPLHFNEYEVHHKDGNKRNNDLDNLDILTKEEHRRLHNL